MDAHLVVVGEMVFGGKGVRYDNHAFKRSLQALVGELGVRDAVHFLGQRDDVPELLRALDLSLLPSWEEPFGLVTVESMAVATPPLVGAVGAGPELVDDRVSGRLLPPKDPRPGCGGRGAAARPRRLQRMSEAGPAAAARFRDAAMRAGCWPSTRAPSRPRCGDRAGATTERRRHGRADLAPAFRRQRPARLASCAATSGSP